MKTVTFQKKLTLNKETVSNLNSGDMNRIMAGNVAKSDVTIMGYTQNCTCASCIQHICDNSEVGRTCISCETCDCLTLDCNKTKNPAACVVVVSPVSNACHQTV